MTKELTPAVQRVLEQLDTMLRGGSVSLQELAESLNRNTSTVYQNVHRLRRLGLVSSIPGKHRSMHITQEGRKVLRRLRARERTR